MYALALLTDFLLFIMSTVKYKQIAKGVRVLISPLLVFFSHIREVLQTLMYIIFIYAVMCKQGVSVYHLSNSCISQNMHFAHTEFKLKREGDIKRNMTPTMQGFLPFNKPHTLVQYCV